MPIFHTYTYTIHRAESRNEIAPGCEILQEGILAQDLEAAVAHYMLAYTVSEGYAITVEQVHTVTEEEIPEGFMS